jgi:monoamine oxidase
MSFSDVVVIGAGLAGLSAARALRKSGASVRLLEARSRLGGRVHTVSGLEGLSLELGAQFISDGQLRMSSLVDEVGLTRVKPFDSGLSLYFADQSNSAKRLKSDRLPLNTLEKLDALLAQTRLNKLSKPNRSGLEDLKQVSALQLLNDVAISPKTSKVLAQLMEPEICYPLAQTSAFDVLMQIQSMGGLANGSDADGWFLKEGLGEILEHLSQDIKSDIYFNEQVLKIQRTSHEFEVESTSGIFRTKQVVVAVPPQLYKSLGLYELLPKEIVSELDLIRPGNVVKTILVFDEPWWRDIGLTGRSSSAAGLFNATLDTSPEDGSVGVLTMFSSSTSGVLLSEYKSEQERVGLALEWLKKFEIGNVPQPILSKSTDWNSDPLSLGGYSSVRTLGSMLNTGELYKSRDGLHFAGTETAMQWRTFMEGALESAERVVRSVKESS